MYKGDSSVGGRKETRVLKLPQAEDGVEGGYSARAQIWKLPVEEFCSFAKRSRE